METHNPTVCIVLSTCPDQQVAKRLAEGLVEARLAACVNIIPQVHSVFRWEEEVQTESEVVLVIKTITERYPDLESWLQVNHPYDVPEILMVPVGGGSASYLNWVRAAARLPNPYD